MTLTKTPIKRPTTHHKKRIGQHHKRTHDYRKAYWPYLPMLGLLGFAFVLNGIFHHAHHDVLGYATNISNQILLEDTNAARGQSSETPLKLNAELTAAAQAKANDMATRNYWNHVSPDGKQPWSFIEASGYNYEVAGENLAYGFGTSDEVVSAWMQSPEHKANILKADYQEVGFATANVASYQGSGPETIVVALYAQPAGVAVSDVVHGTKPTVTISTTAQPVSRLQTVAANRTLQLAVAVLCGAATMLFLIRHALAWHKVLIKSEAFILHHPLLDILLVSIAILGVLIGRIAGTIL